MPLLLLALSQNPDPLVFRTLGWGFLMAAAIWLVIWQLLRPRGDSRPGPVQPGIGSDSAPSPLPAPEAPPEPASPAAPPVATSPKPAPTAGKVIDISRRPRTPPPAHADIPPGSGEGEPGPSTGELPSPPAGPASADFPGGPTPVPAPSPPSEGALPEPAEAVDPGTPAGTEPEPALAAGELGIQTATAEEAAAEFREELEAGLVRQDPVYGIVYLAPPGASDDLKKIKGIASVLEAKLNRIGVYQYRQISVWTAPAVAEFSKLLTSFKDRITRDDWISQAKRLQEETHGPR